MTLEMQVLDLDSDNNVSGLNPLIESQPSPLENRISNDITYKNKL